MSDEFTTFIKNYPTKRIKVTDGLRLSKELWTAAHDEHHQALRYHARLGLGCGILVGLRVFQRDTAGRRLPDQTVRIEPGIAIDYEGNPIVLTEWKFVFLQKAEGYLRIAIGRGEWVDSTLSKLASGDEAMQQCLVPTIVSGTFALEPGQIELARILRDAPEAPIADAGDALYPKINEIDLRCRREIAPVLPQPVGIAMCALDDAASIEHYRAGVDALAQTIIASRTTGAGNVRLHVRVDHFEGTSFDPLSSLAVARASDSAVWYVLASATNSRIFDGTYRDRLVQALHTHRQAGGVVLAELIPGTPADDATLGTDAPAWMMLRDMLNDAGYGLNAITPDHAVLREPHLFAAPPLGFGERALPLHAGDGALLSMQGYGRAWNGEHQRGLATREDIRSAQEFGENLLHFGANRWGTHA